MRCRSRWRPWDSSTFTSERNRKGPSGSSQRYGNTLVPCSNERTRDHPVPSPYLGWVGWRFEVRTKKGKLKDSVPGGKKRSMSRSKVRGVWPSFPHYNPTPGDSWLLTDSKVSPFDSLDQSPVFQRHHRGGVTGGWGAGGEKKKRKKTWST